MLATEVTEYTEVYSFVGAALAANNPSDRDKLAAKAAPTILKTSVYSVTSVANI